MGGLFSGEKETVVGTTITRAIEDDKLPNAINRGVLSALIQKGKIDEYLMENINNGIALKAERMYTYAKDNYTNGLPSGRFYESSQGFNEVTIALSDIENTSVILDYLHFGSMNEYHYVFKKLQDEHGYNTETNKLNTLSTIKNTPVYLYDIELVIPIALQTKYQGDIVEYWDTSILDRTVPGFRNRYADVGRLITISDTAVTAYIKITYCWEQISGFEIITKDSFNIPISDLEDTSDYFQAKYLVNGVTKYWNYKFGTNVIPELENVFSSLPDEHGTFFPFVYFRNKKIPSSTDPLNEEYITSTKLLKYLGMDYEATITAINDNPDISHVEQALMMFAVPAKTTNIVEQKYLFDFIDNLYTANISTLDKAELLRKLGAWNVTGSVGKFSIVVQDKKSILAIAAKDILKRVKIGNIGAEYASTYSVKNTQEIYFKNVDGFITEENGTVVNHLYTYKKQISSNVYVEYEVNELKTIFHVYGEYNVIGEGTDPILLIPIDQSISKNYSNSDREVLYARSLHYVFNCMDIIKIKWYQTMFFQGLFVFIAAIIAVASFGTQSQWLGAALAAGEYAIAVEIIIILLEQLLVSFLIGSVISYFIKRIGLDIAFIVAVIAAAYGLYTKFATVSMQQATWGEKLLNVASGLATGVTKAGGELLEDLLDEANDFNKYIDEQFKLLEDNKKLLDGSNALSPYDVMGTPEDFYKIRIHSGNIGTLCFDHLHNYVDIALSSSLPKFTDTIGGFRHG